MYDLFRQRHFQFYEGHYKNALKKGSFWKQNIAWKYLNFKKEKDPWSLIRMITLVFCEVIAYSRLQFATVSTVYG